MWKLKLNGKMSRDVHGGLDEEMMLCVETQKNLGSAPQLSKDFLQNIWLYFLFDFIPLCSVILCVCLIGKCFIFFFMEK